MKKAFLFLTFALFSFFESQAQNTRENNNINTYVTGFIDTLTNTDTDTNLLVSYPYPYSYEINVRVDSLSGATSGALYLEHKQYGRTYWYPVSTTTIDGVLTQARLTGSVLSGQLRLRLSSTGTQSTACYLDAAVIRKTQ